MVPSTVVDVCVTLYGAGSMLNAQPVGVDPEFHPFTGKRITPAHNRSSALGGLNPCGDAEGVRGKNTLVAGSASPSYATLEPLSFTYICSAAV